MALPQHCPSPVVLDDLELLALGAAANRPFDVEGSPFSLALPPALDAEATDAGGLELVDPEGLVVARATPGEEGGWEIESAAAPAYGPFRRLRVPAPQVRAERAPLVPIEAPLTAAQVGQIAALGPVRLLVLAGHGRSVAPSDLVRDTLAATRDLAAIEVVVAPLAVREGAAGDVLRAEVLAAYGDEVVELTAEDGPPAQGLVSTHREQGVVVLFTGLSGSGKSTIARALVDRLLETTPRSVTTLDGDVVRRHLSAGLSFSPADRETNIRRIGWVGAEIARHGGIAICSPIAPYDATRQEVRAMARDAGARFVLVHVATPLAECERRDRKGLYAKARAGEIGEFTGISAPYETPQDADVVVDTTDLSVAEALAPVLEALGLGAPAPDAAAEPNPDPDSDTDSETEPSALPEDARPVRVLAVCTANICRSPYLQLALAAAAPGVLEVRGAGTHGWVDHPMDATMAEEARRRGLDPDGMRGRTLSRDLVEWSDVVLTATERQRRFVVEEYAPAFRKVFTLAQFARGVDAAQAPGVVDEDAGAREVIAWVGGHRPSAAGGDITDPYRRGAVAAAECADHIDALLAVVAPALARR